MSFNVTDAPQDQPLRFPIQDVYRFDERRILAGRVEAGALKVGDRLVFSPTNKTSTVKTIERWNAPTPTSAVGGRIHRHHADRTDLRRRAARSRRWKPTPRSSCRSFKARLFWLGKQPFAKGRTYKLKLATQEVECHIESIEKVIDASTLETVARQEHERSSWAGTKWPS